MYIGIWLFHFLTDRSHFVRLPGGISEDHPVLSGVPQGTVLGPLLLLLLYALFNHPRLLIQVAPVQKAQFSYRLDGLVP